jgi:mannitol-specific phosphotransferase system IIBC component
MITANEARKLTEEAQFKKKRQEDYTRKFSENLKKLTMDAIIKACKEGESSIDMGQIISEANEENHRLNYYVVHRTINELFVIPPNNYMYDDIKRILSW